jgi:ABC-type branched-subunit amino acid transport system ATPase component
MPAPSQEAPAAKGEPRIVTRRLNAYFGDLRAVRNVSLEVADKSVTAIIGPSGCGKSTFMKLCSGLRPPSKGRVLVDGRPVSGPLKIVGMAFQNATLLPWRTTLDNVLLPLEIVQPYRASFKQKKAEYERLGARLTYMGFIAKAIVDALRRYPIVNASIDGDNVVYKKDINLGVAVALESGLIVPVLKHADEKNLLGLIRGIADLAERARARQLRPEEVHDGTFTITNPGQSGAQFGMPIINQPQVAILGVGTIEKRPVVVDDAIAIRTMAYLTLGFDHRLIDGAVADEFMDFVKNQLENFDASQV